MNKHHFRIGSIAKMHNISLRTMRWYDKIGLLKPSFIDETNGYRYYDIKQFEELDLIKYLKHLGIALEDIQTHLTQRDIHHLLSLLNKQELSLSEKIQELSIQRRNCKNYMQIIQNTLINRSLDTIFHKNFPTCCLYEIPGEIHSPEDFELLLKGAIPTALKNEIAPGNVGLILSKEDFLLQNFDEIHSIFILASMHQKTLPLPMQTRNETEHICVQFQGHHKDAAPYYKKLWTYINENRYVIDGPILERSLIDAYLTNDSSLFLREIQIPIAK